MGDLQPILQFIDTFKFVPGIGIVVVLTNFIKKWKDFGQYQWAVALVVGVLICFVAQVILNIQLPYPNGGVLAWVISGIATGAAPAIALYLNKKTKVITDTK